jgi:hypothetical protein
VRSLKSLDIGVLGDAQGHLVRLREEANMCTLGANSTSTKRQEVGAVSPDTPPELVFPSHYPFSWTLRGARTRRLRAENTAHTVSYRISGSASDATQLAAAIAFCEAHDAKLELAATT